jgi:hypothetical protein
MKNTVLLSLSLVAFSGTAGLGLSALHEFNMNVQTSALATPDNMSADSGFVIPEYVPDAAQFAAFAPTLAAPATFEAPVTEPVRTAALDTVDVGPGIDDQGGSVTDDQPQTVDNDLRTAIAQPTRRERSYDTPRPSRAAPVFVAQASVQQFSDPVIPTASNYVIGVYR